MRIIGRMLLRDGRCDEPHQANPSGFPSTGLVDVAAALRSRGVSGVMVIDVDGPAGKERNLHEVERMVSRLDFPVTYGGGLGDSSHVSRLLRAGVNSVVIGSRGLEQKLWFAELVDDHPGSVVLALDCRNGEVLVDSRKRALGKSVTESAALFTHLPLAALMLTMVDEAGGLAVCDTGLVKTVSANLPFPLHVWCHVDSAADVAAIGSAGAEAVVLGESIYGDRLRPASLELTA
ncbi:MAG TPA: HisA/HisF-related TIM barrel protein [Thermoplasmata archaeon]|nr:HisA/HisF-related TIM barrel protein [Thermoplasmata archaeon]